MQILPHNVGDLAGKIAYKFCVSKIVDKVKLHLVHNVCLNCFCSCPKYAD